MLLHTLSEDHRSSTQRHFWNRLYDRSEIGHMGDQAAKHFNIFGIITNL